MLAVEKETAYLKDKDDSTVESGIQTQPQWDDNVACVHVYISKRSSKILLKQLYKAMSACFELLQTTGQKFD